MCQFFNNGNITCSIGQRTTKCFQCSAMDNGVPYTDRDKLFEFTDVHTTGKPLRFTSKRAWNKHLKSLGKYQLTSADLKNIKTPQEREKKSDYRDVAIQAWKERHKFVQEVKYGKRRLGVY